MSEHEPLLTVATFDSLVQCEMACSFLEAEGIRSFVADGELVNMNWFMSGAVGGVKLQVSKEDFTTAERLLNSRRAKMGTHNADDYGLPKSEGITAEPGVVRDDETEDDEEANEDLNNPTDAKVDWAWKAAVLGLLFCPPILHVYSVLILLELQNANPPVSPEKRGRLWTAIIVDGAVFFVLFLLAASLFIR